ncbi:glycoside hydrolase domain-containing protein [Paenibacillus thermotolerans]|uniref:glycoside hydrolase domain-containing protein n=1 Tax=Paenibacillus thermotolerans TaxID=3027807 RepID=UPI002368C611|nr:MULTISPECIES: glycoside hydrolase domain-containing protein [unclassified Paenibacillus]
MSLFKTRCVHSLVKVFADADLAAPSYVRGTALLGEHFSFQVAYWSDVNRKQIRVTAESGLPGGISLRSVGLAPSELPNYGDHDDYLLRMTPGLYPDPLFPPEDGTVHLLPGQWRSLWVDVYADNAAAAGLHEILIRFTDETGKELGGETFVLEVIGARLPEQKLIRTEWFYLDCLATWYGVETFSEEHWDLIDAYVTHYVEYGMNMILTPLFTPPLEMLPGNERPTVQLVGVSLVENGGGYAFDFSRLERWIELCRRKGVQYFEFSHLYTQWGAKHAPKIVAECGGEERRIFGWESAASGEAYVGFLREFVPALLEVIRSCGLESRSYFHISDEPHINDLEHYRSASELMRSLLGDDYPIIDALSDYEFYKTGLLSHPVCSTEHIHTFIDHGVNNLWAYYCCCEYRDGLSNRFFNMPSLRTRVIGLQLYKYDIAGFLHWGYNHWYSQKSLKRINPYLVTDADHGFPSGDAFLVYPGEDGRPVGSIRAALLREAMQDVRALQLLEELVGRERTLAVLEEGLIEPLTFTRYEKDEMWLLGLRERVNRMIQAALSSSEEKGALSC